MRLTAKKLGKSFGGFAALADLDLSARPGQIVAVIGPNGSGKTTLLDLLSGFLRSDTGTVSLSGKDVTRQPPWARARMGMVRSFQTPRVIGSLSVFQNLQLAAHHHQRDGILASLRSRQPGLEASMEQSAERLLKKFSLSTHIDTPAASLSSGERRLLEFSRVLLQAGSYYLLDEPTAGLAENARRVVMRELADLRNGGNVILMVEHDMDVVLELADVAVLLVRGRTRAKGPPDKVIRTSLSARQGNEA